MHHEHRLLLLLLLSLLLTSCSASLSDTKGPADRIPVTSTNLFELEGRYRFLDSFGLSLGRSSIGRIGDDDGVIDKLDSADSFTINMPDSNHLVMRVYRGGMEIAKNEIAGEVGSKGFFELSGTRVIPVVGPLVWMFSSEAVGFGLTRDRNLLIARHVIGAPFLIVIPLGGVNGEQWSVFDRVER